MGKSTQTLLGHYVSIYELPNKKCSKYADEEKAERARIHTISYPLYKYWKRERTTTIR